MSGGGKAKKKRKARAGADPGGQRRGRRHELDEAPSEPVSAVLALGTNLGDRAGTLQSALGSLETYEGVHVRAVSPVVETSAVGGPDQPDYLNAVVALTTTLSPLALLDVCHQIEAEHGRVRLERWGPRTLDLDVITYGDLIAECRDLEVPHPRASSRAFVLFPWARMDPAAVVPMPRGPARVEDLLAALEDDAGLRVRGDVELRIAP